MKLLVTAPASGMAVDLAAVKLHLRLDTSSNAEDSLLELLIQTAMDRASHELGRSLLTTGYTFTAGQGERLRLPRPNLIAVSSVIKTDHQGGQTTCTTDDYSISLISPIAEIKLNNRDDYESIVVAYTAGYGTSTASIPAAIRQWILVDVATLYENREAFTLGKSEVANAIPYPYVGGLLDPYRVEY